MNSISVPKKCILFDGLSLCREMINIRNLVFMIMIIMVVMIMVMMRMVMVMVVVVMMVPRRLDTRIS
uniref:Uncharacterized protein n=1 Tax=Anopheles dirus TaxID=7168 RepID=A0A182NXB4_9DIPT